MRLDSHRVELKRGIHDFPTGSMGSTEDLVRCASLYQKRILLIACSEQGAAPDNISFANADSLVILQHLAASVPSKLDCENINGLSFDDVEQLFRKHDFHHVIVSGHLDCGVIRNWLRPAVEGFIDLGSFRHRFEASTRNLVEQNYAPSTAVEMVTLMICEHVLSQLDNLLSHPFVMDRVLAQQTFLHGWVVDDDSARVLGYHPDESAFVPI